MVEKKTKFHLQTEIWLYLHCTKGVQSKSSLNTQQASFFVLYIL